MLSLFIERQIILIEIDTLANNEFCVEGVPNDI